MDFFSNFQSFRQVTFSHGERPIRKCSAEAETTRPLYGKTKRAGWGAGSCMALRKRHKTRNRALPLPSPPLTTR